MLQLLTVVDTRGDAAMIGLLIGLLIGSFLNVVIHRLPLMMQRDTADLLMQASAQTPPRPRYNLLTPHSACPHCNTPLACHHNIPLFGYLWLRGRCAYCRTIISPRYPAVEVLSAGLSAVTLWHFGIGQTGLAALTLVYFLIALSFIDADTQLLPDQLTLPLLWLGLLVNLKGLFVPLGNAVVGAMAGYLSLWLIYWLFRLATGKEGIGYGDFKMLAALGAWFGWPALPLILLLASCLGAMIAIALVLLKKHEAHQPLPFGPYLALGGMLMLWREPSWQSIFSLGLT